MKFFSPTLLVGENIYTSRWAISRAASLNGLSDDNNIRTKQQQFQTARRRVAGKTLVVGAAVGIAVSASEKLISTAVQ